MSISTDLLAEFEEQAPLTRCFLERLPQDKLTWKPHEKSMAAGQLAYHLALIPGGVISGAQKNEVPPPDFQFPQPESVQQILDAFDAGVATVRGVMPSFDDGAMHSMWRVVDDGKEVFALPRQSLFRNILLNHWYQHRGQFSVYLRMLDIPVPATWGPSADERSPFSRT